MRTLFLKKYKLDLATRDTARLLFKDAKAKKVFSVSFTDISSVSRSFMDEIFLLSHKYNIRIIDIPPDHRPLYELIIKSHDKKRVYAPELKINKIQVLPA